MKNIQNSIVVGLLMLVLVCGVVAAPQTASAQTNYTRAQLISEIERLLAELVRQDSGRYYYYSYPPAYQYQYRTNYNYSNTNGYYAPNYRDVDVETLVARDVENDEAEVYGSVDLNGNSYAWVWFEYGEDDDDLDEDTGKARVTSRTSTTFRGDLDNLDSGERYYYRAVAEGPNGDREYGRILNFTTDGYSRYNNNDDDEPEVETGRAYSIDEDSARIDGEVDMNDFNNGLVFFVFGEDDDQVEDIADEYDEYRDIDEDGDDLQKFIVDSDLDGQADYIGNLRGLDDDTRYYFSLCVEYKDEDDDSVIECGGVEDFETDRD